MVAAGASPSSDQPVPIGGLPSSDDRVIAPVPLEALPEPLRSLLAPRVRRLGYLGAFFSLLGHQPAALQSFFEYTEALKAALPEDLTDVVALTVATHTGNVYERVQHERLARSHGHSAEWVSAAATGTKEPLTAEQRTVRLLTEQMILDHGHQANQQLRTAVEDLGTAKAVAVVMLVGRYLAHAHIANTLRLSAPEKLR